MIEEEAINAIRKTRVLKVLKQLGYEYYEVANQEKTYEVGQISDPISWSRRVPENVVVIILGDDVIDKVKDCEDYIDYGFDRMTECFHIKVKSESFWEDFKEDKKEAIGSLLSEEEAIDSIRDQDPKEVEIGYTTKSRTVYEMANGKEFIDKDFPMEDLEEGAKQQLRDTKHNTKVWVDEEVTDFDGDHPYYTTFTYIDSTNKRLEEGADEYSEIVNIVDSVYNDIEWGAN